MKCVVIYFSLTGNTEKIARAIQTGIRQVAGHCDILPIKEADPRHLRDYDLIGLGNPIMGGAGITVNVSNFIKDMRFVGGKHAFTFCTSHSALEHFPTVAISKLKERGLTVIGWEGWHGAGYGPLGEPTPSDTDGHPDEIDLQEAEAFGREMVWRSQKIYAGDASLIPEELPVPVPAPGGILPTGVVELESKEDYEMKKLMHFRLIYDKEKCLYPRCTLCMDNCPVDGIDLTVEPPVIGKPCMTCMMCDQLCPTGAMLVDDAQMKWQFNLHFGPDAPIPAGDGPPGGMARKKLTRQYVSPEKVAEGRRNQVYKVYDRHPRFVIGVGRPYGFDPATLRELD